MHHYLQEHLHRLAKGDHPHQPFITPRDLPGPLRPTPFPDLKALLTSP